MAVFIGRVCHTGQNLYRLINKLTTPDRRLGRGLAPLSVVGRIRPDMTDHDLIRSNNGKYDKNFS
jgi:hypothetical protein